MSNDKHGLDNQTDREKEVIDADDTGMVDDERALNQAEIEQALKGIPPTPRP